MANVRPFRGLRFDEKIAGAAADLCCPPYDIIPDASVWRNKSQYNVIRLEKPEGDTPYRAAADTLVRWKRDGVLTRDEKPAFYRYEIGFDHDGKRMSFSGILAHVELTPFSAGVVLPHENTLSKAKQDRYDLMTATGCHFSPVYSLFKDGDGAVARLLARPDAPPAIDFRWDDGTTHRLWPITDEDTCAAVTAAFADKKLYIADGHHRYETSLRMREELGDKADPNVMMMLVDMADPGLVVFPTHRMLSNLETFDAGDVLRRLDKTFVVEQGDTLAKNAVVMLTRGAAHRLTLRDESFDGLDVSLLHDFVLEPIFGINAANMASQTNLTYTRDAAEAAEAVERGDAQCAFLLNPTRVAQIAEVADAGGKMPQKSTYFYPKLITGLVINEFLR